MYLENAWCLVCAILYQPTVTLDNSIDVLFNGLFVELTASFLPVPQVITWGWLVWGGGEPRNGMENNAAA